ncbi:MAG: BamA/TamA family outer membrane protein [Ferruginibacter sp.]|nr:BamA/TamA family outer membrane protein [Ferruginibacter sp.]
MKYAFIVLLALLCQPRLASAQDSIKYSILLIGDAGEINPEQHAVLTDAIRRSSAGKTMALFLGDNIYRRGMGLDGDDATANTEAILRSQYQPLRTAGVPVYFIPGNHDWDHSGSKGFEKISRVNQFVRAQQDSLLQMIPQDACPGPYEVKISDDVTLIAIDSEWWLFPFDKHVETSDCECKSKADVLGKLQDIVDRNRNKIIFFASHHPFRTNGSHGGYYSIKEHVFPLTGLNKSLYIPLPVIGSLYPILRKTFPPAQDLKNVLYKEMIEGVEDVLKTHPNVIHVAGHEHTLQLIQGALLEVVSGAGCKNTPVRDGKGTLFAESASGYVKADVLLDNSVRLSFFSVRKNEVVQSFTHWKAYTLPGLAVIAPGNEVKGDSITIALGEQYNKVGKTHRKFFGENYRTVWATQVPLPVLRISQQGLVPTEMGGGMQTRSLRLVDAKKDEWVLRSVDKYPDVLLPPSLRNTFAATILKDNVTAAFPYAPLVVPEFAKALNIPHSSPSIVYVAADTGLGLYGRGFAGTVNLFERREPLGKSVSTAKMVEKLKEDNDHSVDQQAFLTARLLDIFLGDWDRHGDQWRWIPSGNKKSPVYQPVPRDRDQVFYLNEGFFPSIFALPWIQPKFQGFGENITNINTFSFNARFIDGLFTNELSAENWKTIANDVVNKLSDQLIDSALKKMPSAVYEQVNTDLSNRLKKRKLDMLQKSPDYFRFLNKVVDITTSDKNEWVEIVDTAGNLLSVSVHKISKTHEPGRLMYHRLIDPAETRELRLYLYGGEDSVVINNKGANVKLRIVADAKSAKTYSLNGAGRYLRKVHIYEGLTNSSFNGDVDKARLHRSSKQENTAFQVSARYNKTIPLINIGYNVDDGFILGGGARFIRQGFRKNPYGSAHQFTLSHSFATKGFKFKYGSEWMKLLGSADLLLNANVFAPDNTQNFFGRGNETFNDRTLNSRRFYRTVFTIVQVDPALRWRSSNSSFSVGPSFQYYSFDKADNKGRFINNTGLINSYDSATIGNDKAHLGLAMNYVVDTRNSTVLPTRGSFVNFRLRGYNGMNDYSRSYGQATSEIALFRGLGRKQTLVIANRLGGGVSFGKTTFYQSLFLGGHENLLGYRQHRFAGQHMMYNNLEARLKLGSIASYLVPGQFGLMAFYDIGRVWENDLPSKEWHQGVGGGLYFSPAQLLMLQLVAGKSKEGWYPYFTMGFRF